MYVDSQSLGVRLSECMWTHMYVDSHVCGLTCMWTHMYVSDDVRVELSVELVSDAFRESNMAEEILTPRERRGEEEGRERGKGERERREVKREGGREGEGGGGREGREWH